MAIGFPSSYSVTQSLPLDSYSFGRVVEEAFTLVGWEILERTECTWTAKVPLSGASWGERLIVSIGNGHINVESVCYPFQIIDWGKNRRNVATFIDALISAERSAKVITPNDPAQLYERGESVVDRLTQDGDPEKV